MKKYFPFIGSAVIIVCGGLLHYSLLLSDRAAWSLIVSSVNDSAWELFKPVGFVYIFWIIIELSYLRPSLMHFVCAKTIGMYVLCFTALGAGMAVKLLPQYFAGQSFWAETVISVAAAQAVGYGLYYSDKKVEIFRVPLLISILCMVFLLIVLTFYPPHWKVFV